MQYFIGLMSGTSLDGIDAVLLYSGTKPSIHAHTHRAFPDALRSALLALNYSGSDELHRAAVAAQELAQHYALAVSDLLQQAQITAAQISAIGCHGQTIRHRPDAGYTVQLVNAALLAELTHICVVCDFRSRDIAAGGEGAPLVPAFHRAAFGDALSTRAIVNIGGIANITTLFPDQNTFGFDCGPGNILMDAWIQSQLGKPYDDQGQWAGQGQCKTELLNQLLTHPFFARNPPKSTGRDLFHLNWLRDYLTGHEAAADVQATLLELTARTISNAIRAHCHGTTAVFLCGGGAHNSALFNRIGELLPEASVASTALLGIAVDHVEAAAFAWLAQRTLRGESGNLAAVTGARGPRILGAIYPA
jgi:anhydro-N-acetylmuramic acid kinase